MKKLTQIISILFIFLIACSVLFNKKEETTLTKVRVAEVAHSIFYAPQYVAINNNYFKEEGLEIDLILTPGADKVISSVLSNTVDIGFSGSEATIYVYNGGETDYLKTFAQLTQKDGSFLISRNKIDNFTLNDLKGKTIIAGRLGGMPEMTLEYILKKGNINLNELTLDTSIQFASMQSAFIQGTGDFVSLFEPNASDIVNNNLGYKVASLGELGGIIPYTSYSARISYIENNKDIINKFNKAIQKGLDYVNNHTSSEIANIIKDDFKDTNINDLINTIENYKNINTWPSTTNFTESSFNLMQDIMINANQLEKKVNYNDLIYK